MKQAPSLDGVPRETEERLRDYLALLIRWNARINLVAQAAPDTLWVRHVVDSAQLAPFVPPGPGPLIDLGSGAGFPGLVLAALTGRETHLVESDRRKCAFLQEAARLLGLSQVIIHPTRIEAAATLPLAAVVSARALAPLSQLLRYTHRLLLPGGVALFPKGRNVTEELTAAAAGWTMRTERFASRTDPDSTILRLSEISPVSAQA
ncbi:16S rRNA (guanine(527)-N(7))-methyltransferase RsmG [Belnapia rosea]|uniref:16S rRNA (guanine(527)-N(7))-methyltransferase RsmG n=1 Tax=Belnapia rosea TaxID=938405 RepID=UPI000891DC1E|nr:16S rRNA (guanine(527)-N(7))-methyltransferase RsmG [Belnapia rosea]SDB64557.1 16S rRNA (guanine527-N7)-methyltransferase [Belnapia rosea]